MRTAYDLEVSTFMYKFCMITTITSTIKVFIQERIEFLRNNGFEVTVLTALDESFAKTLNNVRYVPVPFSRTISLLADIFVLFKIYNTLRKGRFDIVQYIPHRKRHYSALSWAGSSAFLFVCMRSGGFAM